MTKRQRISRRLFLGGGLGVAGLAGNMLALSLGSNNNVAHASPHMAHMANHSNAHMSDMAGMTDMAGMAAGGVPTLPYLLHNVSPAANGGYDPSKFADVASSAYAGTTSTVKGQKVRTFNLVSIDRTITVAIDDTTLKPLQFAAWAFGTSAATASVPGPTLRCTEGETVVINYKNMSSFTHSIHFHGIHNTANDGSLTAAAPGQTVRYEFLAEPSGLMAYHCHVVPTTTHVVKGLYGAMIIDPKTPRSQAAELILVMNGFPIAPSMANTVYAFNSIANHYSRNQVAVPLDTPIRVYLLNMVYGTPPLSFHLHANFFNVFPAGTKDTATEFNDMLTTSFLERHVLEFTYDSKNFTPGSYMFHCHDSPGEMGMFGMFILTNGAA